MNITTLAAVRDSRVSVFGQFLLEVWYMRWELYQRPFWVESGVCRIREMLEQPGSVENETEVVAALPAP